MKTERELFEAAYCKVQMIDSVGDTFDKRPNDVYVRQSLQLAWIMWQASANREGYKLVPVECTEETAEAIASVARCCGGIADAIYCAVIEST